MAVKTKLRNFPAGSPGLKGVSTLKPLPTVEMPKIVNRTCSKCKGYIMWDSDGGQWICFQCGNLPFNWGGGGISGSHTGDTTQMSLGFRHVTSNNKNSGLITRIPKRRNEIEVKAKAPESVTEAPKARWVSEGTGQGANQSRIVPIMQHWTHYMTWGEPIPYANCMWPDGKGFESCKNGGQGRFHCHKHRKLFFEEFGERHLQWRYMRLWQDGGEITIDWIHEKLMGRAKVGGRAKVVRIQIPDNAPEYGYLGRGNAWRKVRETFEAAMEYKVQNFHIALIEALKDRDARGKERLT